MGIRQETMMIKTGPRGGARIFAEGDEASLGRYQCVDLRRDQRDFSIARFKKPEDIQTADSLTFGEFGGGAQWNGNTYQEAGRRAALSLFRLGLSSRKLISIWKKVE